ncbi:IS607 family transposase [Nonomuraea sp. PA05]|uniref:recombinase family protein n=1 Tax=Nonomuraea sp. PA05 TaxID=2604466 RepID=UPI0011D683A0|nr:recombinase family protein [Nonomuraea sp. PA05]TYB65270.1 IS607 family transposase [Nonomuraea sp. PA05]
MKLFEWAKRNGVHYQTAWKRARDGTMPVPVVKTATGRYMVLEQSTDREGRAVADCRVSSADQETDLERPEWKAAEIGPAAARSSVAVIVVEHRDRLTRFGLEHLSAALEANGRRIVVIDDAEVDDDLVRDMTEVLTSFCARLYGRRSAARRAKAALRAAREVA